VHQAEISQTKQRQLQQRFKNTPTSSRRASLSKTIERRCERSAAFSGSDAADESE